MCLYPKILLPSVDELAQKARDFLVPFHHRVLDPGLVTHSNAEALFPLFEMYSVCHEIFRVSILPFE